MSNTIYDLLGVGFGPSGIAVSAAIEDWVEANNGSLPWKIKFLEKNSDSAWQGNLLLPGTDINNHHFRDLATPRNPRSQFTFTNYLKEKGRIFEFGQLGGAVSRYEWSDYVIWAAEKLLSYVDYNQKIQEISPIIENEEVLYLLIKTNQKEFVTKSLILSTGSKPYIPEAFKSHISDSFFHTAEFLPKMNLLDKNKPLSFMVIGSGQSAGEVILYLRSTFSDGKIYSVHRSTGFKLYDFGHFSNIVYFPEETDYFYNLETAKRKKLFQDVKRTNYASIDWDISKALHWLMYEDKLKNEEKICMLNRRVVVNIEEKANKYQVTLQDIYKNESSKIEVDVVILGTGYREEIFPSLLNKLTPYINLDEEGGATISRDYKIQTSNIFSPTIYLNGLSERTHGISDAQSFSLMALKAEVIFNSWFLNRSLKKNTEQFA